MEVLPEDCIAHILSRVTPQDVCRFTVVASAIKDAAESEVLWDKFLPPDYHQIISRSVSPLTFESKKELFFKLSAPILIDGGLKVLGVKRLPKSYNLSKIISQSNDTPENKGLSETFSIEKATGKKCYTLSARDLYIAWSSNSLFWCWKPCIKSRFSEVVELRMTSLLEIEGKINTRNLSPNTHYRAYLITEVAHYRAFGLDVLPCEVSVEVGEYHSQGKINFSHNKCIKPCFERTRLLNKVKEGMRSKFGEYISRFCLERKDGWLEIELGEFYNDGSFEKEVKMNLREVNGVHLKGGLIVEGIEIRPI